MIICPSCQKELRDGAKFCSNCGTKIEESVLCAGCGAKMPKASTFCSQCGTPLKEQPAPSPAQPEKAPEHTVVRCPACNEMTSTEFPFCQQCGCALPGNTQPWRETILVDEEDQGEQTIQPDTAFVDTIQPENLEEEDDDLTVRVNRHTQPVWGQDPGDSTIQPQEPGMVQCGGCGSLMDESLTFCQRCGAPLKGNRRVDEIPATTAEPAAPPREEVLCIKCGAKMRPGMTFCQVCGATQDKQPKGGKKKRREKRPRKEKKPGKKGKRLLILLMVLLLSGALAAAAIFLLPELLSEKGTEYVLYLQDGELLYQDLAEEEPVALTTRLTDGLDYSFSNMQIMTGISEDGRRIFYPDRIENGDIGVKLYCRDLRKPDEDPIKIDSGVIQYAINQDGSRVIYVKDGAVYVHDLEDKEKISGADGDESLTYFQVNQECTMAVFLKGNEFCIWTEADGTRTCFEDCDELLWVAEDFSAVCYRQEETIYRYTLEDDSKEKLDSDVSGCLATAVTGQFYYTKKNELEYPVSDRIEDDMAEADAKITKPEKPDYPDAPDKPQWWDYEEEADYNEAKAAYDEAKEEYDKVCERLRKEYEEALAIYKEKENRDIMREWIGRKVLTSTVYKLYYYDGSESILMTDSHAGQQVTHSIGNVEPKDGMPLIVGRIVNQQKQEKVKISQFQNEEELQELLEKTRLAAVEWYVAVGGELASLEDVDMSHCKVSYDSSVVYLMAEVDEEAKTCELYRVMVQEGKAGELEYVDSDVSTADDRMTYLGGNKFLYFKAYDESTHSGDAYLDGVLLDSDVYTAMYISSGDMVMYLTDYDRDAGTGTLKTSCGGTITTIAEDASGLRYTGSLELLYVTNIDEDGKNADLYRHNDGEPVLVAEGIADFGMANAALIKGFDLKYHTPWMGS